MEAPFGDASSNPLKKDGRLFDNNVEGLGINYTLEDMLY